MAEEKIIQLLTEIRNNTDRTATSMERMELRGLDAEAKANELITNLEDMMGPDDPIVQLLKTLNEKPKMGDD